MDRPRLTVTAIVLDAPNARDLAAFYRRLLGWEPAEDSEDWVMLRSPSGACLSFQSEPNYVRPVWPAEPGHPPMMAHLDIAVDDLAAACAYAAEAGATLADFQPQDHVRVHLDPAGHPFCLYVPE
jgi:catechol 2,3-dioxygenase-like lactoylglutathione lyase family enzyme